MRPYQFKTINNPYPIKPVTVPPSTTFPNTYFQQIKVEPRFTENQSFHQHTLSAEQIKANGSSQYNAATTAQSLKNISTLKKQLDMLVKQTDYIESRKKTTFSDENQDSFAANRSLSNGAKVNSRDLPNRNDRMKNYQKYQKYLENNSPIKEPKFGTNQPVFGLPKPIEGNITFYGNQNSSLNVKQQNERPISNFNSLYQNRQINSIPIQISSQAPYKSTYQIPRNSQFNNSFSPLSPKVENPEKYLQREGTLYPPLNLGKQKQLEKNSPLSSRNVYPSNYTNEISQPVVRKQQEKRPNDQKILNFINDRSVSQLQQKLRSIETQKNKLKQNLKTLEQSKQYYRTELFEERKKYKKLEQEQQSKFEEVKKQKYTQINNIREEHRVEMVRIKQEHEKQQKQLLQRIEESNSQNESKIGLIKSEYEEIIKELRQQIEQKKSSMANLIRQLNDNQITKSHIQSEKMNSIDIQDLFNNLAEKEHEIGQLHSELHSRDQHIQVLNQTFHELKAQIEELKAFKNDVEVEKFENFDQILMTQMKTINDLKNEIETLNEKLNDSQLSLIDSNRQCESLMNQIKIMEFKQKTELSGLKTQKEIEVLNLQNSVNSLNKKMMTLEQKLKSAIGQIKTKDEFVKQYLVGRASTTDSKQHIQEILAKYQQQFSESKQQQLTAQLEKARKQLKLYQKYVS